MKKVWALMLLIATIHISCEKENTCDTQQYFDVTGLRGYNMYMKRNAAGVELGSEALYDQDSIKLEDYYLDAYLEASYYATRTGFSFLQQAMAKDNDVCPNPGYLGSAEKPDSVNLIALGNFSPAYPAGSSLNRIVRLDGEPIQMYLNENASGIKDQYFRVTLTEKPTNRKGYQAFKLIYKLKNGETYEVVTTRLKLL